MQPHIDTPIQPRRGSTWIVALFCLLTALVSTAPGRAYNRIETWDCQSGKKWGHDPSFGFSSVSFPTSHERNGVSFPASRINAVGAQSFDLQGWTKTYSTVSSGNLRNEIWIGQPWGDGKDALMTTVMHGFFCSITETDIVLNNDYTFRFGEPWDYDLDLWRQGFFIHEGPFDGDVLARPPILHELLHVAGLDHVSNAWAMQNYGKLPWVNGDDATKILEPLPDDARGLRAIYPTSGSESEVFVANFWYYDSNSLQGAATQQILCKPSGGSGWASKFSARCGKDPTTKVCPGDTLYTRIAIGNRGTAPEDLTYELFFSLDDHLSPGPDVSSPWSGQIEVHKNYILKASFEVPALPPGTYWPIVRVEGGAEESYRNNWIPLTGQVIVPPCPVVEGGGGGYDAP